MKIMFTVTQQELLILGTHLKNILIVKKGKYTGSMLMFNEQINHVPPPPLPCLPLCPPLPRPLLPPRPRPLIPSPRLSSCLSSSLPRPPLPCPLFCRLFCFSLSPSPLSSSSSSSSFSSSCCSSCSE